MNSLPPSAVMTAPAEFASLTVSFPTPRAGLRLSVVVPVRNEAAGITQTLAALAAQTDDAGNPLPFNSYEVLLLANNCTDATADAARAFARRFPEFALHVAEIALPPVLAHVGAARRLLMDAACRRLFGTCGPRGVIATTDGDTLVAPDWVFQTLREVERGADAVGGRIRVTACRPCQDRHARLYHLRDHAYQRGLSHLESHHDPDPADPWPRHHQFFGGSLAVTAAAYCRAGGLPVQSCLEDVAFGEALRCCDARIRHSPDVRVSTSARQDGRTPLGLSVQLREWGEMGRGGHAHWVQQPAAVEERLRARRTLRRVRNVGEGCLSTLAARLLVPCSVLRGGLDLPFGAHWAAVMEHHMQPDGLWARRWPLMEITDALPDLRRRLAAYR